MARAKLTKFSLFSFFSFKPKCSQYEKHKNARMDEKKISYYGNACIKFFTNCKFFAYFSITSRL